MRLANEACPKAIVDSVQYTTSRMHRAVASGGQTDSAGARVSYSAMRYLGTAHRASRSAPLHRYGITVGHGNQLTKSGILHGACPSLMM